MMRRIQTLSSQNDKACIKNPKINILIYFQCLLNAKDKMLDTVNFRKLRFPLLTNSIFKLQLSMRKIGKEDSDNVPLQKPIDYFVDIGLSGQVFSQIFSLDFMSDSRFVARRTASVFFHVPCFRRFISLAPGVRQFGQFYQFKQRNLYTLGALHRRVIKIYFTCPYVLLKVVLGRLRRVRE